ncbi:nucleoside hydrolase [Actinomyces radicidentis]|uniref:uridine-preferring nucleoside hydrolase UriH n=1 Tax=Actinomyces radicidentis TaxID=111015 RepID=UPI0026E00088|nr:nucleoside hydrolase [Actinomyces radicidentis]
MTETRRIILDCDPGHDDAAAIILALGNPSIELLGVTTVGGNQTLAKITRNAQRVLALCGREDVPVHAGAARPLLHEVETAPEIHGESGLDGVELPEPSVELAPGPAASYIVETVMAAEPGTITLVGTGPLTNLALAARLEPRIVERVHEVVVMGGGYPETNWTPAAEFNIWVDPEAASIVFDEPWPLTMVGLDLTHQALCTPEAEAGIREIDSDLARAFLGLMAFFRKAYQQNQAFEHPPVHDPCTIAYLIDPEVVRTRVAPVHVETAGRLTTGMTVVDLRRQTASEEGVHTRVATELDHAGFWRLITEAIRALG